MLDVISIRMVIAVIFGGGLGYGYYRLVGCSTGACPLTSNPWISTIYGALLAAFLTYPKA